MRTFPYPNQPDLHPAMIRQAPAPVEPQIGWFTHLFVLLVPFTAYLKVNVSGTLYGQDALFVFLFPILLWQRNGVSRLGQIRFVFFLLAIWLGGQIFTDLIRDSALEDYARGWSKIVFFGLYLATIWLLIGRRWSLFTAYMAGEALEQIVGSSQLDYPYSLDPWKFGIGSGVVMIGAVAGNLIGNRGRWWSLFVAPGLVTTAGLIALFEANTRGVFGIALMAAMFIFVSDYVAARPRLARKITPVRFGLFILGGLAAAQLLLGFYGALVESGALGNAAQQKYEMQTSGDVSLLQGGRVESLVSLQAIADSPIIGHGSWAHDGYYVRMLAQRMVEKGLNPFGREEMRSDLIPTHSFLFGAWVESGILGAVFWLWVLCLCLKTLYHVLRDRQIPSPIIVVMTFNLMWDIFFSPFGAAARLFCPAEIAMLLYAERSSRMLAPMGSHTVTNLIRPIRGIRRGLPV